VVLEGEGSLLLYDCAGGGWMAGARHEPEEHEVRPGSVVVRPAGSGVAHAFRAGATPFVVLMYGERRSNEISFYPRSRKIRIRSLGVTGRLEYCRYFDGETGED